MTRRQILSLPALALSALSSEARAQQYSVMASRAVTPLPRGKPSRRPFNAKFVNVADAAGLRSPVIYGDEGRADYILESMGCGAAFVDYDNDGWLDIVMLTGRRRTGSITNRDGTFKGCLGSLGSRPQRLGSRHYGGRLRQRRL